MDFSIKEAINSGWKLSLKNWKVFFLIFLFIMLLSLGLGQAVNITEHIPSFPGSSLAVLAIKLLSIIVGVFLQFNLIKIALKVSEGKEIKFSNILEYSKPGTYLNFFAGRILRDMLIALPAIFIFMTGFLLQVEHSMIGFILFALGTFLWVYLTAMFLFYGYSVADKNLSPIAALKESLKLTSDKEMELVILLVALTLMNALGALVFFIGLFITVPASIIAIAHVFRKLESSAQSANLS